MAHNKMMLVSDDSEGPGGGRYSPLWEQALSCDQSPRRDIPSPYLGWRLRRGRAGPVRRTSGHPTSSPRLPRPAEVFRAALCMRSIDRLPSLLIVKDLR